MKITFSQSIDICLCPGGFPLRVFTPPGANGMSAGYMYTIQYGYQGSYVANPGRNFELGLYIAKSIPTTSVDDCASFSASQSTGNSLYFALGTNSSGDSSAHAAMLSHLMTISM